MTLSQLDLELMEHSDKTLKVWTIFTNIHNDICVIIAIDNETQCWYDEFWWPSRCCWDPYSVWILYTVLGWDTAFEWCTGIIKKNLWFTILMGACLYVRESIQLKQLK